MSEPVTRGLGISLFLKSVVIQEEKKKGNHHGEEGSHKIR